MGPGPWLARPVDAAPGLDLVDAVGVVTVGLELAPVVAANAVEVGVPERAAAGVGVGVAAVRAVGQALVQRVPADAAVLGGGRRHQQHGHQRDDGDRQLLLPPGPGRRHRWMESVSVTDSRCS
jgi:hypothetical protein